MDVTTIDAAVEREDWRGALEHALAWWQQTRAPELADLVEALGTRLATPTLPAAATPVFHELWLLSVGSDPIGNLGPALATVTRALPLGEVSSVRRREELRHKYAPWLARIAMLHAIDDPRIATAFVGVLRAPPFLDEFHGDDTVYDPLLDALVRLGDVRQVAPLRALAERPTAARPWLRALQANALPPLASTIAEQELPAFAERADVADLLARLTPRPAPADDAELLDLVHADPDADGPREVLADRWLERGEPRGELVTLQLKEARGTATPADRKKVASLLRKHERAWLGVLGAVTKNRRWDRGFLDEIELHANAIAAPATWAEAAADPALRTVRTILKGKANETHYRRLVMGAPDLRAVSAVSKSMVAELCAAPRARLAWLGLSAVPDRKDLDAILAAFPRLTTVSVPLRAANVDRTILRIASLLPRVAGRNVIARVRNERDAVLARWLLAVRDRLAPLREVTLALDDRHDAPSISASAGDRGLRVRIHAPQLHAFMLILQELGAIEHVTLTTPPGATLAVARREDYEQLLAIAPRVTLDASWQAFVAG